MRILLHSVCCWIRVKRRHFRLDGSLHTIHVLLLYMCLVGVVVGLELAFLFLSFSWKAFFPLIVFALLGRKLRVKNMSLSTCYLYIISEFLLMIPLRFEAHR